MQHRVGARLLGVAGEVDGLGVELEPAPAITGTRFLASLMHSSTTLLVLVVAERGALAGGADRDQPVRALGDLPLDQPLEGRRRPCRP
jgi:hypothetical protein